MNAIETLYDWCMNNNNDNILKAWDYEKNPDTPKDIGKASKKERYFYCPICGKSYQRKIVNLVKFGEITPCPHCRSFGQWCLDHERKDLLKRWDYEKNDCSPFEVWFGGRATAYFKCPRGIHESELKQIRSITSNFTECKCNECESFGQWGIDNFGDDFIEKYWSDKNTVDPMKIFKSSRVKVWIKCQEKDYHQDYEIACYHFTQGKRCPYCAGKKVDPNDSLGAKYPECQEFWFQKNLTPFQVLPESGKKVYWECKKHGLYRKAVSAEVAMNFRCPKCILEENESSYQATVRNYLESIFGQKNILHEGQCNISPINPQTGRHLRYDNQVVPLKLIIEVNGKQHYAPIKLYTQEGKTPQEALKYRKGLDKYKRDYAIKQGYNFLTIPYWQFDIDKTWKKSIDEKIKQIQMAK